MRVADELEEDRLDGGIVAATSRLSESMERAVLVRTRVRTELTTYMKSIMLNSGGSHTVRLCIISCARFSSSRLIWGGLPIMILTIVKGLTYALGVDGWLISKAATF